MSKHILASKEAIQRWKTRMSSTMEKLSIRRPTSFTKLQLWQPAKQQQHQLLERLQLETQKRNLQWKEWVRLRRHKWQTTASSSSSSSTNSRWSTTKFFMENGYQQLGATIWRGFFRWSLAVVFVYGVATTLPMEIVREFRKTNQTITSSSSKPTTSTQSTVDSTTAAAAGATDAGPVEMLGTYLSKMSSWIGSHVFKDDNQK